MVSVIGKGAARVLRNMRIVAFWDPVFQDWTAVVMGAFDTPTQTKLALHIFVSEKGDYYDIADGLPQNPK